VCIPSDMLLTYILHSAGNRGFKEFRGLVMHSSCSLVRLCWLVQLSADTAKGGSVPSQLA
jgi:hypothetical protein